MLYPGNPACSHPPCSTWVAKGVDKYEVVALIFFLHCVERCSNASFVWTAVMIVQPNSLSEPKGNVVYIRNGGSVGQRSQRCGVDCSDCRKIPVNCSWNFGQQTRCIRAVLDALPMQLRFWIRFDESEFVVLGMFRQGELIEDIKQRWPEEFAAWKADAMSFNIAGRYDYEM